MYGMFMPVMFFTTLIGLVNIYIVDRLCLAYYYRKPPAYDAKLNLRAIGILKKAPLWMFLFGYWALGNRQIFFNETHSIEHLNEAHDPHHPLMSFRYGVNHTHFILLFLMYLCVVIFFGSKVLKCMSKLGLKSTKVDVDVDENLSSYW